MLTKYIVRKANGEIKKAQFAPGADILQDTELQILAVYEKLEEAKAHLAKLNSSCYLQHLPNGFFYVVEEYYISEIEAESMEAYESGEWDIVEDILYTREASVKED